MPSATTTLDVLRLVLAEADRDIRARLIAVSILVATAGLLAALAPLALKGLIDTLASSSDPGAGRTVLALSAAYIAALCAGRLLNELRPLMLGPAGQRLQGRLSRRFFAHVLDLPAAFHLNRQTGALAHTLSQGSAACQSVMTQLLQALPIVIELGTAMVVLGQLGQPALAATFLASALAYTWVFRKGMCRIRRQGKEVANSAISTHATLADSLLNIETIKCFNAKAATHRRYGAATTALEHNWSRLHGQRARLGLSVAAVFGTAVAASLVIAVRAVEQGTLSIGGFVLATVYMLQLVRPIETIGAVVRDITQAVEFAGPALELLRHSVEDADPPHSSAPPCRASASGPVDIHLIKLQLAYPGSPRVLNDLSLRIPAGTRMAIVGPSGSGKSSLARVLLRLVEPDAGQVLFGGLPSEQLHRADIRQMIGYVSQDVMLFDDTIAANIAIGRPEATDAEIKRACRSARVHDFVRLLPAGYATRVGERGLKLSGGERQRIALARAILKRPQVYLFDEATSALDSSTEADIVRDLPTICAGCTLILITHRLATARCAETIAVLQEGRIAELGTHQELLQLAGTYARMCDLQADHTAVPSGLSGRRQSA
jgi:ATP-binding cassette subfamily B protein